MNNPHEIEKLLKGDDVARILNVSRTQAYRLMRESLTVVRFGGATVRVRLSDLEAYIAAHVKTKAEEWHL